jgi:hypothetical protein
VTTKENKLWKWLEANIELLRRGVYTNAQAAKQATKKLGVQVGEADIADVREWIELREYSSLRKLCRHLGAHFEGRAEAIDAENEAGDIESDEDEEAAEEKEDKRPSKGKPTPKGKPVTKGKKPADDEEEEQEDEKARKGKAIGKGKKRANQEEGEDQEEGEEEEDEDEDEKPRKLKKK